MKFTAKEIFTIPNILTYIRLLCVPVFIWLMVDSSISEFNTLIALGVFLFASVTDVVDGYIARKFNMVSDIGKVTDPLADKMLQLAAIICLTVIGNVHYAFIIIFAVKELYMILGGAVILKVLKSDYVVESNIYGKIGSLVNTIGMLLAFFHEERFNNIYYIDWAFLGLGCLLAVLAAVMYTRQFVLYEKKRREQEE